MNVIYFHWLNLFIFISSNGNFLYQKFVLVSVQNVGHHMAKKHTFKIILEADIFLCAYFIVLICLCINLSWIWHKNEFAAMTVFRNEAKLKSIMELRMANYLIETWRSTVEQTKLYVLHSCGDHLLGWFLIHMWNRIVCIVIKHTISWVSLSMLLSSHINSLFFVYISFSSLW